LEKALDEVLVGHAEEPALRKLSNGRPNDADAVRIEFFVIPERDPKDLAALLGRVPSDEAAMLGQLTADRARCKRRKHSRIYCFSCDDRREEVTK
jgi:hypothetical protein